MQYTGSILHNGTDKRKIESAYKKAIWHGQKIKSRLRGDGTSLMPRENSA